MGEGESVKMGEGEGEASAMEIGKGEWVRNLGD